MSGSFGDGPERTVWNCGGAEARYHLAVTGCLPNYL